VALLAQLLGQAVEALVVRRDVGVQDLSHRRNALQSRRL
jgi:hypothetical protein